MASEDVLKTAHFRFAASLYSRIITFDNLSNLFVCPYSIYSALALVSVGACSKTKTELHQGLQITDFPFEDILDTELGQYLQSFVSKNDGVKLSVANKLYADDNYPILEEFIKTLQSKYGSTCEKLDFCHNSEAARKTVNDWVLGVTNSMITNLLPPGSVGSDTKLILTNAAHFKGLWTKPFEKNATSQGDFYLLDGSVSKVQMMHQTNTVFIADLTDIDSVMVKIPFGHRMNVEFMVILPNKKDGLKALLESLLKIVNLETQTTGLEKALTTGGQHISVQLTLPRFQLGGGDSLDLIPPLKNLGMQSMFNPNEADFSNISGNTELFVSGVYHQALLKVDEEGAEAAAATAVCMMRRCVILTREVKVDHPFVVAILGETGVPLFVGHCINPLE